jgi:hypothetical protein
LSETTAGDREILRSLAQGFAEIASLPIMAERRANWKRHNALERVRPTILIFPEGSWRELLPESPMKCEGAGARRTEWTLRSRIYHHQNFQDDTVIENEWVVNRAVHNTGWGLTAKHFRSSMATGAWKFDPVIKTDADLDKIKFPRVYEDEDATARALTAGHELFGDILVVKRKGIAHISFHLMNVYTGLRGLEQVMWDMVDDPNMVHDAMAKLEEGHHELAPQYVDLNLLSLNNDATYHSTGGNGYSEELPLDDFDPDRVRPCDMWASAESQEFDPVSPDMHEEFALQYEKRLLEPFALTGYGCCDDLEPKLHLVAEIPGMRRVSIAPMANVDRSAEKLGGDFIFSWKPQPALLVGEFDADMVRDYIRHTLDVSRDCVIEMILKDTHTCENHPERFNDWTRIAREWVEAY